MRLISYLLSFTFLTVISCKSDSSSEKNIVTDTKVDAKVGVVNTVKQESEKHNYQIMIADIESKLEGKPDGGSDSKVTKNTLVKLLNESSQSEYQQKVNKRNYKAPYQKVEILDSGKETWVFGGALQSVYSGVEDISDVRNFQSFASAVADLDPLNLDSGIALIDNLQQYKSDDIATSDAMFFMSYDYINQLARSSKAHQSLVKNHKWTLDDYNEIMTRTMDMEYHPVGKVLHQSGLSLDGALGDILVVSDITVIEDILGDKVSTSVKEYIELVKLSFKSKVFDNDNIVVPLTSVVNQANKWTQFTTDNPNFAHVANATMKGDRLMQGLLYGTKNTPAFDHASRVAKQEYRTIWEYVLQHYADSPMGVQVASHTKWLEGRDWKFPLEKHAH